MLIYVLMIISGILLLVWSADKFTDGAAAIARNFGVSPLIVGLTIVAIGSSAPEMIVSLNAALKGSADLAVGNAIGSNIANIGLVLGITALVSPIIVQSQTVKREIPILFAITILTFLLMMDNYLNRSDGVILFIVLIAYLTWLTRMAMSSKNHSDAMLEEIVDEIPEAMSNKKAFFWAIVGLIVLQMSANVLVSGAVGIAHIYYINPFVIGTTIIAVGTSLPELAASISGVLKGEHDLAIGNVIGSNIFNLLAVLGIPAVIVGQEIYPQVLYIDFIFMFFISIIFALMAWGKASNPGQINRFEGSLLLILFISYIGYHLLFYFGFFDITFLWL